MKAITALVCIVCFFASSAFSGEIFGSITQNGKPIAQGVKVGITASGKSYTAETDKFGSYRFFVKEKGKASFVIHVSDQSVTADVFSYDKSTRYDWLLETKDGKLTLRRK